MAPKDVNDDGISSWILRGTPAYRRLSLALFLAGFATFSLLYCVQPLLPLFSSSFKIGAAESSLSLSLATGALAFSIVAAGVISEGVSRTKLIFASLAASAVLNIAASLAPTWPLLLLARLLEGVALGGVPAVAMAYLAEEIDPRHLGFAMGVYIGGTAFGGMLGRVGMAVLLDAVPWRAALSLMGLAGLAAAIGFWLLAPPSRNFLPTRGTPLRYHFGLWRKHLESPLLRRLFLAGFFAMGAFVTVYNYLTYRLIAPPYDLSQTHIGFIFFAYLFGIAASPAAGAVADRAGQALVLLGAIAFALAGVALAAASGLVFIVAGVVIFTFGFFSVHSVASGWVAQSAVGAKGHASALYLLAYYLGSSLLGSLGGAFWEKGGWAGVAAYTAALLTAALAVAWRLYQTSEGRPT